MAHGAQEGVGSGDQVPVHHPPRLQPLLVHGQPRRPGVDLRAPSAQAPVTAPCYRPDGCSDPGTAQAPSAAPFLRPQQVFILPATLRQGKATVPGRP